MALYPFFSTPQKSFTILQTTGTYSFGPGFGLCVISWIVQLLAVLCFIAGVRHRGRDDGNGNAPLAPLKRFGSDRMSSL